MDFRFARKKLLSDTAIPSRDKTLLDKVSLKVHRNDGTYILFDARQYLSVGLSAVRCIENALKKSSKNHAVKSILDFPCGGGRVLRFLIARFPKADITASEIDSSRLNFCKKVFSVKPVISSKDFRRLSLPNSFDLIWCGSLITHLDESATSNLLKFFHDHLSPGGLCVFTAHGQLSVEWIEKKVHTYGLTANAQKQVLSRFYDKGYGYADYKNCPGYGISLVSRERMQAIARNAGQWDETSFLERGWDNHQDVYGFTKNAT